jgi:3-phenylpropionate/trans-cinnamate dioxygenase ferredoxin subunit
MEPPYVPVARADEIRPGRIKQVLVDSHPYLLANVDGRFYAVDDTCSHEDFSLSYGRLEGDRIKCSLHGSRFCLRTGRPQDEPAEEPIGTYRVVVRDGTVWIDTSGPSNL